ncbi:hypothetical protein AWV79_18135 [Cupriavidus sp. UYMMa02A]|nr:hypothetical protein AWV79_18135 [Cupriavidus sp. UYMMa02A]
MFEPIDAQLVDDAFVQRWEPQYDAIAHDETEYQSLVHAVHNDVDSFGAIREATFRQILEWKSARTKGHVHWWNYGRYIETMRNCLSMDGDDRLDAVCKLPGVAARVGSTILHFIYPDTYPIFDIRTLEALRYLGADLGKSFSVNNYYRFREYLISTQVELNGWTLRELDRALFAFHKRNPEIFGATLGKGRGAQSTALPCYCPRSGS